MIDPQLLPVTHYQIQRLVQGKPDEVHGKASSCESRRLCAKAFGKEILHVLATPFSIFFRLVIIIKQLCLLIFRAFLILRPNGNRIADFKAVGYELADQLILLTLEWMLKIVNVLKLGCAILVPRLYFKNPEECLISQQIDYYRKSNHIICQKLVDDHDEDLTKRSALEQLISNATKLEGEIPFEEGKRDLLLSLNQHLKAVEEINPEKLQELKELLIKTAKEHKIEIEIIIPEKIDSKKLVGSTSRSDSQADEFTSQVDSQINLAQS